MRHHLIVAAIFSGTVVPTAAHDQGNESTPKSDGVSVRNQDEPTGKSSSTAKPDKSASEVVTQVNAPEGWNLVFHDEFNGSSLNRTKWNAGDPWGKARNTELQAYVEQAVEVRGGSLRIVAKKEQAQYDKKLRDYTSGMVTTYKKFSQEYGRFEVRCRVPNGKGLWPAFWLLPEKGWPPEIDILEILGHETNTIYFTHHWKGSKGKLLKDSGTWKGKIDFAKDMHVIAVEWTPKYISWEVDGIERFRSVKSIPRGRMFMAKTSSESTLRNTRNAQIRI